MIRSRFIFHSCFWIFATSIWVQAGSGQTPTISEDPLSDRRVTYTIQAQLDPVARTVTGSQRLTWVNPDQVPVEELQFHLYLNAFRDSLSTFMVESAGQHRGFSAGGPDSWGGIEIQRMRIVRNEQTDIASSGQSVNTDLMDRMSFIRPGDGNVNDFTVLSVALPEPVQPGERIALDIDFESKLPEVVARTGWKQTSNGNTFFMVAQWFPKIGVYEVPGQRYVEADAPRGQWSTHQFHANSEFYADFGVYEVEIAVPEAYTIGASGVRVKEQEREGVRYTTYRAEDVHDFAWTASQDFEVFLDEWEHVQLRLLMQPEHKGQADRHFEAVKAGLKYFTEWVGPYPYTTLTLVDGVGGSNGMEYPTLITCGTSYMMPDWLRLPELVTVHELGHQYFYGILASNEAEEAWLDEGITSYVGMRVMEEAYGRGAAVGLPWFTLTESEYHVFNYRTTNRAGSPIVNTSWRYRSNGEYQNASYSTPAILLRTLERYLGWDVMKNILQTYYQEWRFRHPTTRDFVDVVERVSGDSLDWFFDQYLYGTQTVDYAVKSIDIASNGEGGYTSTIEVARLEEGYFPLTIRVLFADGVEEDIQWDGLDRETQIRFEGVVPVEEVYIDPGNTILLDVNRLNNRKRVEPETRFAQSRFLNVIVWMQHVLQLTSHAF